MSYRDFVCWIVLSLLCLTETQASAAILNWDAPVNGEYRTATNWNPAVVPDSSDTVIFDHFAGYTVTIRGSETRGPFGTTENYDTADNLEITAGTVFFEMFRHNSNTGVSVAARYRLSSPTTAVHIGGAPGSMFAAKLVVNGGVGVIGQGLLPPFNPITGSSAIYSSGALHIGRDADSSGILEINGGFWSSDGTAFVGLNGFGVLKIQNEGRMFNSTGLIGFNAGSTGTVTIDQDSHWDVDSDMVIGGSGSGLITANGKLENGGDAFIASAPGSNGSVDINDEWVIGQSLYVGGTETAGGGAGSLDINNATVDVGGDMKVHPTATFTNLDGKLLVAGHLQWLSPLRLGLNGTDVVNAGQLTIAPGSSLLYSGSLANSVPGLEVGQLNAPAASMTWTSGDLRITNGDFGIDDTAPIGHLLELNSDRPLQVSGALRVGTAGTMGELSITGGVAVPSGSGQIGNTNPASRTISVVVDQSSSWEMSGDLTMGSVGSAGAQLVVSNSALVSNVDAFISPNSDQRSELTINGTAGLSEWQSSGSVYLGGKDTDRGGTATLTVEAGGFVNAGTQLLVWDQANVRVIGGELSTPLLDLRGTLDYAGTFDLTGTGSVGALSLNRGTINANVVDFGTNSLTGMGTINGTVIVGGNVSPTGDLTLGDVSNPVAVQIGGNLNVSSHNVRINQLGSFLIGSSTSISGGSLTVSDRVALPFGEGLTASGAINGRFLQEVGSTVLASGDLIIGNASSNTGFASEGDLIVNNNRVTLRDANAAVLGAQTTLGSSGQPGVVAATNGALLESSKSILGFGEVDTPNDPAAPLTNNGAISGNSPSEPITLSGYVTGIGTLDNATITGTDAPGASAATVTRGSVTYDGTLEIEIGGTTLGEFDRIEHTLGSGFATLGGTLDVSLISGFEPELGDSFGFLFAAGGYAGTFDTLNLPNLGPGLGWVLNPGASTVFLEVSAASFSADFDLDGDVDSDDLTGPIDGWEARYGTDLDGSNFLDWQRQFGSGTGSIVSLEAVPEPSCLALCFGLFAAGVCYHRPRI